MLEYAADLLDVSAEKLDMKDSEVFVAQGSDEKRISLKEIAYHAHLRNKQFIGVGRIVPPNSPTWEAHFAEVEVDLQTGQVKVIKLVGAHDVGKAINPAICEGQIEVGLRWG